MINKVQNINQSSLHSPMKQNPYIANSKWTVKKSREDFAYLIVDAQNNILAGCKTYKTADYISNLHNNTIQHQTTGELYV